MNDRLRRTLPFLLFLLLPAVMAHAQWRKVTGLSPVFYNEVFFIDNDHGWLTQFNATVTRTIDGGTSWQTSSLPGGTSSANRDLCFLSTTSGFASGGDGIWKTADGGISWTNITPPSYAGGTSTSCWFIDANNGVFGAGDCGTTVVRFYRTSNGGITWDSVQYTHTTDVAVGGIAYVGGVYYAAGGSGKFWSSGDGGATWSITNTGSGGWQEDLTSFGNGLYIASADGSSCGATGSGKLLRSIDNGATWSSTSFPGVVIWGISMYSSSEGWGCGDGGNAYKTVDGGLTWTPLSCGMSRSDYVDDIHFTDATHGWAVGTSVYKFVSNGYSLRPDTINFGDVVVGSRSNDSNAVITALGTLLTATNRVISGTDPTQFNSSQPLGLQTVGTCLNGLTPLYFAPTSEGVKVAQLVYTIAPTNETAQVYLKGRGVKPRLAAQSALVFDTLICSDTELDTIVVKNNGNYALKITSAIAAPVQGATFNVVAPSLSSPVSILPNDSLRFIVQVRAQSSGTFTTTLAFANNDPDSGKSPWNVRLTVIRRTIGVTLSSDSVDLPGAALDVESGICINYHNSGDGDQSIQSVAFVGGDAAIHQVPSVNGFFVAKGMDQKICFNATVKDTLMHVAYFRIRTLPCNRDTVITVRYQARNPVISTVAVRSFGEVSCDSGGVDTVMVRNTGNAPLILEKPYFNGANSLKFNVVAPLTWPDTIPIGGSLAVSVGFTGDVAEGDFPATMVFPSNDLFPGKSNWGIEVRYHRGRSELTPSRRLIDVGDICVNGSRIERVMLKNTGSTDASVRSVSPIGPAPDVVATGVPADVTIVPTASDSLTFTIAPVAVGPFSAQFVVRYLPCDRLDTIVVIGRAVGIALAATPPSLDYGSSSIGRSVQRTFTVTNNGGAVATITAWAFQPALANAKVILPAPPIQLSPGESRTVTVELTPADTIKTSLTLLGIAEGPCPDTLRTPISVLGVRGAIVTNRYHVDYGSLLSCAGAAVPDTIRLVNYGAGPITLRSAKLAAGASSAFRIENGPSSPVVIAPGDSLLVIVSALTDAAGVATDTLLFDLDQPEQPLIAIPLEARRERAGLAVNDPAGIPATALSFGSLAGCNPSSDRILHLHNTGTIADTISIAVAGASFSLRSTPAIILAAGADTTVVIRAAMSAPGADTGTLTVISRPCSVESLVRLDARYGTISASVTDLNFASVNVGRTIELAATITNTGEGDQVIDHLEIDPPSGSYSLVGAYAGIPLPAQASLPVRVSFTPATAGPEAARIVAVMREPCPDTLYAKLDGAGIRSNIFLGTRDVAYGERLACQDSCATLHIEAAGSEPVSIFTATLEGTGTGAYRIDAGTLPIVIGPGSSADIKVCFDPAAATAIDDAFAVLGTSDSAQPLLRLKLSGSRGPGLNGPEAIRFTGGGAASDTSITIANGGATPIVIDGSSITGPYTLLTGVPITVPAHDSVILRVRHIPSASGGDGGLVLRHTLPCADSLLVALLASENERQAIALRADTVLGRWGEHAAIPIALGNPGGARLSGFDLAVTAAPGLLDPQGVGMHPSLAGVWTVSRSGYDATTGTLILHLSSTYGPSELPSIDTLLTIDYLVLRGGLIASEITLAPSGLPPNVTATTIPGAFLLADYCDAYGRLLRARGDVALDQNKPNPFNPTTTIEFETAFDGDVRLVIYDELGREVRRVIDGPMPAGRRQVMIDAADLPSGVYTYRLTTGLQTLMRRMVVAK